jgi:hypothetical protein
LDEEDAKEDLVSPVLGNARGRREACERKCLEAKECVKLQIPNRIREETLRRNKDGMIATTCQLYENLLFFPYGQRLEESEAMAVPMRSHPWLPRSQHVIASHGVLCAANSLRAVELEDTMHNVLLCFSMIPFNVLLKLHTSVVESSNYEQVPWRIEPNSKEETPVNTDATSLFFTRGTTGLCT